MIKKTSFCVAILNDVIFLNFPFNRWRSALQPYPGKCITWSHQLFQSGSGIYIAVVLTLRKNNSITRESVPFSLEVVEEALVFICTWIFCVCRLHNINCHNYGHNVLQDCSLQNAKKVNFLFTCCSIAILPYWTDMWNIARASMSSGILAQLTTEKNEYGTLDYKCDSLNCQNGDWA